MPSLLNATIGEYRLVDFLGAGGMGEVYRAVHTKLGRVVAIKILSHPERDASLIARSYNEARIQASLQHPGIASFYGFYEYEGLPCILMEYVDGESLADRIHGHGVLQVDEALSIMERITSAVAHIHQHGIIHRDLKSNNIKITTAGEVKILDFGIAKAVHTARVTKIGAVIGTLENLSPEQIEGREADSRSDVWALGVLFYEILTGRLPFEAGSIPELYTQILSVECTPPSEVNPEVGPEVEEILLRCLRKKPSDRYPSAAELHDAFVALAAKPDAAPPAKAKTRRWLWAGAVATAAVALALLLGINTNQRNRPLPPRLIAAEDTRPLKTITVEVVSGVADVYRDGRRVGVTPYRVEARIGDKVELELKRPGFRDLPVQFDVSERASYSYTMQAMER